MCKGHEIAVLRGAAGPDGGHVVTMGTPEEVAVNEASLTGRFLAPLLRGVEAGVG
jgi:excinuclease UvrABC ATPase subunit